MGEMDSELFIGIVDTEAIDVPETEKQFSWRDNKIGGFPIFSPNFCANDSFNGIDVCCSNCASKAAFILQIYCPIDYSSVDRLLYLFSCVKQSCNKKDWFVYRVLTDQTVENRIEPANENLFDDNWDDIDNDDNVDNKHEINESYVDNELTQSLEQRLVIENSTINITEQHKYFKASFISVFEEPKEPKLGLKDAGNYEELNKSDLIDKGSEETYEKSYASGFQNDKENYRFYKRLRRCPDQIIRYSWSGKPLLSTVKANVVPSPCEKCGSKRVFELQLMPSLISILSRIKLDNEEKKIDIDDFETIIIYTCSKNCKIASQNVYKEESFLLKDYTCNNI